MFWVIVSFHINKSPLLVLALTMLFVLLLLSECHARIWLLTAEGTRKSLGFSVQKIAFAIFLQFIAVLAIEVNCESKKQTKNCP